MLLLLASLLLPLCSLCGMDLHDRLAICGLLCFSVIAQNRLSGPVHVLASDHKQLHGGRSIMPYSL